MTPRPDRAVGLHPRLLGLGLVAGGLAGVSSFAFLEALDWATTTRLDHPALLAALPIAGLLIGLVYHHLGGAATRGNPLLLDEIHTPTGWLPRRMAPLVFAGSVASHLVGASVGREGAALQLSGGISDWVGRAIGLRPGERRVLLVSAIGGGFGAVFGVPFAGAVFAIEVQSRGRRPWNGVAPALVASFVGHAVVQRLGHPHEAIASLAPELSVGLMARVGLLGVACGIVAAAFLAATHRLKALLAGRIGWPPARLLLGALVTLVGVAIVGRDYLGLSLPLIEAALAGEAVPAGAFAWKAGFTVVALASGFPGGEVTPLFVVGATLGIALAGPLGLPPLVAASVGFVAVFAGAANAPLACTVAAVELFGPSAVVVAAVGCIVAYCCSSAHGLYDSPLRQPGH